MYAIISPIKYYSDNYHTSIEKITNFLGELKIMASEILSRCR
jgi:hypothetical protein